MSSVPIAPPRPQRPAPSRVFRFNEAQARAVIAAYEAGTTMAALAKQCDVKRETISKLLRREGVTIRVRRVMSQGEIDQSVQLYEGGLSLQKIGDQLGWDHNTIYRHLKKRGVLMRSPNDHQSKTKTIDKYNT